MAWHNLGVISIAVVHNSLVLCTFVQLRLILFVCKTALLALNYINATAGVSSVSTIALGGTELNVNYIEMLLRDKITLDICINLNCFTILVTIFMFK